MILTDPKVNTAPAPADPAALANGCRLVDLGRLAYAPALAVQREMHADVAAGKLPHALLLVEHDPVITISHRPGAASHVLLSQPRLAELGIDLQETDRGGDVTYHGPGQLVAYPILNLTALRFNVGRYMRWLEQVLIDTLAAFRVTAACRPGLTGVWVPAGNPPRLAKIAALGVRVAKSVSLHGVALNVSTNLAHFDAIVPCGLRGEPVTSLQNVLAAACPEMTAVKAAFTAAFMSQLHARAASS